MACKNCKKKSIVLQESKKQFNIFDKGSTVIIIIWFFLGLYGLYSLIKNIYEAF